MRNRHPELLELLAMIAMIFVIAATSSAQSLGNAIIRGRVTDDTGLALPGVTVTATSPALLVPQVVAVTDGQGSYGLPELPIGVYRVTYDLAGFQRLVREQIQLAAGFSAAINVTLRVGGVEETITVSGQSPVVDTTNTTPEVHLSGKLITDVIPATSTLQELMVTTPGITPSQRADLSGGVNAGGAYTYYGLTSQATLLIDGVNGRQANGGGAAEGFGPDFASLEEMQVVNSGGSAEQGIPGAFINMVVKSGGNMFHGRYNAQGQTHQFQSNNLTPSLVSQGVIVGDASINYYDLTADLGGPIKKDKLWFYTAGHYQRSNRNSLGFSLAPGPDGIYGTADDVPGTRVAYLGNGTLKGTYQVAPKYKIIGFFTQNNEDFPTGITNNRQTPYENTLEFVWNPHQAKVEIQGTPSNRLAFSLLLGRTRYDADYYSKSAYANVPSNHDNTTLLNLGPNPSQPRRPRGAVEPTGSLSFFPEKTLLGSHEFKAGFSFYRWYQGSVTVDGLHGNYQLTFDTIAGVAHQPSQITLYNYPVSPEGHLNEGAVYGQDTWRLNARTTVNLGLRYDSFRTFIPQETLGVTSWPTVFPAGTFPPQETGTWHQVAPRLGVVVNLTADGKTVLKASYGRFNHTPADNFSDTYNKLAPQTAVFLWHNLNHTGDYAPGDVNLNVNGPDFVSTTSVANNILNPSLKNPYTIEYDVSLERELMANFGMRVHYIYIAQYALQQAVNVLRPYSAYTVALSKPDPGPDGVSGTGGSGLVTVYDYPAQFRGSNFVGNELENAPDSNRPIHNVIETSFTRRTVGKWGVLGSITVQRDQQYAVLIPQTPNDNYFNLSSTWSKQAKIVANYQLPWKLDVSGTYALYSGLYGQRTNLFRGIPSASTVTLRMEPYGATATPVRSLLNLRVAKDVLALGSKRFRLSLDVLNALNASSIWSVSYASGPTFNQPQQIDSPRIVRGGVTYSF